MGQLGRQPWGSPHRLLSLALALCCALCVATGYDSAATSSSSSSQRTLLPPVLRRSLSAPGVTVDDSVPFTQFLQLPETAGSPPASASASAPASALPHQIQGKIRLNGVFYRTQCHCGQHDPKSPQSACSAPVRMRVRQEELNNNRGISREEFKAVLGEPRNLAMTNLPTTSLSDIDSRQEKAIIAAPGGDFGQFIVALSVFEHSLGSQLNYEQVHQAFVDWLDSDINHFGQFMLQTDEAAIAHLETHLHVNSEARVVVGLQLNNPLVHLRPNLLIDLLKPANHGSYHIKSMLEEPARYRVRAELLHHLVRSYFEVLWDQGSRTRDGGFLHHRLHLLVLDGEPRPQAWVNLRANPHCELEDQAPLFRPSHDTRSILVNHVQAPEVMRRALGKFFALRNPHLNADTLVTLMRSQAMRHLDITAEKLGALFSIPFYSITVE